MTAVSTKSGTATSAAACVVSNPITAADVKLVKKSSPFYVPNTCFFTIRDIPFAIIHEDQNIKEGDIFFDMHEWNVINIADLTAEKDIKIRSAHYIGLGRLIKPQKGKFYCDAGKTITHVGVLYDTSGGATAVATKQHRSIDIKPSIRSELINRFKEAITKENSELLLDTVCNIRHYIGSFCVTDGHEDEDVTNNVNAYAGNDLLTPSERDHVTDENFDFVVRSGRAEFTSDGTLKLIKNGAATTATQQVPVVSQTPDNVYQLNNSAAASATVAVNLQSTSKK